MTADQIAEQIARLKAYTILVNASAEADDELLVFVVEEILDRVRLYLNRDDVPVIVERPLAKVIASIFNKYKNTVASNDVETQISSVSDNGQSVSYSNSVKSYLTTSSDDELFTGVNELLKRYRGLHFVSNSDI